MTLYFITQNLEHDGKLTARIPEAVRHDENQTIKRVNFCDTLEGCLSSIPGGGMHIEGLFEKNERFFKLFKIEEEKYGIKKEELIFPDELYKRNFVRDAALTGEYWLLRDIQVLEEDMEYIFLEEYTENDYDLLTYEFEKEYLEKNMEEKNNMNFYELFEKYKEDKGLEDLEIEIKCVLTDLECIYFKLKKRQEINLEIFNGVDDLEKAKLKLKEEFSKYEGISFDLDDFELKITTKCDNDISESVKILKDVFLNYGCFLKDCCF